MIWQGRKKLNNNLFIQTVFLCCFALLAAIQRQKITLASPDYNVLLVFAENKISEAVKQAGELREQGLNVAMIPMNPAHDKAYYTNYAEQNRFAKVEWMDGE